MQTPQQSNVRSVNGSSEAIARSPAPAPFHLEPLPDDDWFFQTLREAIAENRQRENEAIQTGA
jgi:hypothetical protein